MKSYLKKIVLSNSFLRFCAVLARKIYLKHKHDVIFGKKVFIGYSTVCEGKNRFANGSSVVSSYLGYGSYVAENSNFSHTKIGRYCSIGPNVNCIFGKHPSSKFVSTHPAFFSIENEIELSYVKEQLFNEYADKRDPEGNYSIIIGNDVWIGANVSIMDGIVIGDGAIIAANALVNKDVPPYSIYGGVPAKEIKKRFPDEDIEFLINLEWWSKSDKWIKDHAQYFSDIQFLKEIIHNGEV